MTIYLDIEQSNILREVLESALAELRNESARADVHDFREMLHRRENLIEEVLAKMAAKAA